MICYSLTIVDFQAQTSLWLLFWILSTEQVLEDPETPELFHHGTVHFKDVIFSSVLFITIYFKSQGHQGDEGYFLNSGQHGGGEDLLQNLRDVLGIHGNKGPASW